MISIDTNWLFLNSRELLDGLFFVCGWRRQGNVRILTILQPFLLRPTWTSIVTASAPSSRSSVKTVFTTSDRRNDRVNQKQERKFYLYTDSFRKRDGIKRRRITRDNKMRNSLRRGYAKHRIEIHRCPCPRLFIVRVPVVWRKRVGKPNITTKGFPNTEAFWNIQNITFGARIFRDALVPRCGLRRILVYLWGLTAAVLNISRRWYNIQYNFMYPIRPFLFFFFTPTFIRIRKIVITTVWTRRMRCLKNNKIKKTCLAHPGKFSNSINYGIFPRTIPTRLFNE